MRVHMMVALSVALAACAAASPATAQPPPPPGYRTSPVASMDKPIERSDSVRLRFGIEGAGGAFVRGPQVAMGGLRARIGLQLGDWLALYYMPSVLGGVLTEPLTPDSEAIVMYNTAMVELTMLDVLQIGAGPSLDFMWACDESTQTALTCGDEGPFFGLDGRVALLIAEDMFGGRTGLTFSADVHPTWFPGDVIGVTVVGGMGLEMY